MKKSFSPSNLTLAVVFMLFFISFSVVLVLNFRPLYYHDIEALGIVESSGISEEDIRTNYDTLISYNSIFGQKELDFPTLAMSESGKIHFEEVKNIFQDINNKTQESVSGIKVLKAFGESEQDSAAFNKMVDDTIQINKKVFKWDI